MRPSPPALAAAIVGWTLLAWGGRIGLLASGDDWLDIARIGGSVLIGAAAAIVLSSRRFRAVSAPVLYVFVGWTVILWIRSLIVNWAGSGTLAFKLVHTVLAGGFLLLAYLVWPVARDQE